MNVRKYFLEIFNFFVIFSYFLLFLAIISGVFKYYPFGFLRGFSGYLIYIAIGFILLSFYLGRKYRDFFLMWTQPRYYLVVVFILYNMFVLPGVLNQYFNFDLFNPHDFCERLQAIYGVFNKCPFHSSIMPWLKQGLNFNIFGDHFFAFLFLLVPFAKLFHEPIFIFVLQAMAISGCVFPLYLIAKRKLQDTWLALLICIVFLTYPLTIKLPFYDFRVEYFALFFIMWAFYFMEKGHTKGFIICIILASLCKENILPVVSMFGIYIILFKKGKKIKILGILIFVLGLATLFFYLKISSFFLAEGFDSQFSNRYGGFRDVMNPNFYISRFSRAKALYLISLFKFLFFIPLLCKEAIFFIPGILSSLGAYHDVEVTVHLWHNAILLPFIFIGFIYGIKNIINLCKYKNNVYIMFVFILIQGILSFREFAIQPFNKYVLWKADVPERYKTLLYIKNSLPRNARYMVHFPLISLFYDFPSVYIGAGTCYMDREKRLVVDREGIVNVDYFIYSEDITFSKDVPLKDNRDRLKSMIPKDFYERLLDRDGFVVLARKKNPVIFDFKNEELLKEMEFNLSNTQIDYEVDKDGVDLKLYFDGNGNEDEFVQMKFKKIDLALKDYSWVELEYEIEDSGIQTIELVIGIDKDGGGEADSWVKGLYPRPACQNRDKFVTSLWDILGKEFKYKDKYKIVALEIYPHKLWGVDCSNRKAWYRFKLYRISFY